MKTITTLLKQNPQVSDYKINTCKKESAELFYVKGKLETVRCTDTCDHQVTVYVDHDGCKGDAQFFLYPSTTEQQIEEKIQTAVQNAKIINNPDYQLPAGQTGDYELPSNFTGKTLQQLADEIAQLVFKANTMPGGSLNAMEVFVNHYTDTVANSRGLHKTQHRYDAMVEAIPTFNGSEQSVELYEQYNFSSLDSRALLAEIAEKMDAVKARYEAVKPDAELTGKVVLNKLELHDLFSAIAGDLNYATVYSHGNLYHKGDKLQKHCTGDALTIQMRGSALGNVNSSAFDSDGMPLDKITLVKDGAVENYYGSNRFGQYLNETPTGNLRCLCVAGGSADLEKLNSEPHLEVISMSGLQVDFFNDYIGGEVRLAWYCDGSKRWPVTGISIAGKLQDVLDQMKLSKTISMHDGYMGPAKAVLSGMKIF